MKKLTLSERIAKRNDIASSWAADSFEWDSKGDYLLFGEQVTREYVEQAAEGNYSVDYDKRFLIGFGSDDEGKQQECWAVKLNPLG